MFVSYGNAPEFVQFSVSFRSEPRLSIMLPLAKFETAPPPSIHKRLFPGFSYGSEGIESSMVVDKYIELSKDIKLIYIRTVVRNFIF